jgi:hypothetical protein
MGEGWMETKPGVKEHTPKAGELIPASEETPLHRQAGPSVGERLFDASERVICLCSNILLFPFRLLWNVIVIVGAITLTVMWLGFLFGSVIGVVLLLIFMPGGFLLPMSLLVLVIPLWKECE